MISTLHKKSELGVCSDLNLFELPATVLSHQEKDEVRIFPISDRYGPDEAVDFLIQNTSPFLLDLSSARIKAKCKIIREDNQSTFTPEVKAEGTTAAVPAVHQKVLTIANFANSLFRQVDIYLNNTLCTYNECYPLTSYFKITTSTSEATQRNVLYGSMYAHDQQNEALATTLNDSNSAMYERWSRTWKSAVFQLVTPIYSDICQQMRLLIPGVNVKIVMKPTSNNFRLLNFENDQTKYKLVIQDLELTMKRIKIFSSVLRGLELQLEKEPALYFLNSLNTRL